MKRNDFTAAPQASNMNALYDIWRETHSGSWDDFYRFITTPGYERDVFLSALDSPPETSFDGDCFMETYSVRL